MTAQSHIWTQIETLNTYYGRLISLIGDRNKRSYKTHTTKIGKEKVKVRPSPDLQGGHASQGARVSSFPSALNWFANASSSKTGRYDSDTPCICIPKGLTLTSFTKHKATKGKQQSKAMNLCPINQMLRSFLIDSSKLSSSLLKGRK